MLHSLYTTISTLPPTRLNETFVNTYEFYFIFGALLDRTHPLLRAHHYFLQIFDQALHVWCDEMKENICKILYRHLIVCITHSCRNHPRRVQTACEILDSLRNHSSSLLNTFFEHDSYLSNLFSYFSPPLTVSDSSLIHFVFRVFNDLIETHSPVSPDFYPTLLPYFCSLLSSLLKTQPFSPIVSFACAEFLSLAYHSFRIEESPRLFLPDVHQ